MKNTKREVNLFRRNKTEVVPAGANLRVELEKHLETLNKRIGTVGLAQHLITVESKTWKELREQTDRKVALAKDPVKKTSLERLQVLAQKTEGRYSEKDSKIDSTLQELRDIRSRVQQAIAMIEVENNLRNVTSMFDGVDSVEHNEINLETETREIRQLLHATDGLMELMA